MITITRVFARNYRSIGEVDLELGAMTALVGPNGSGKSNLADVLRFIGDCARGPLGWAVAERQGFGALRHWAADEGARITLGVQVRSHDGEGIWAFTLGPAEQGDGFEVISERALWAERHFGDWEHERIERLLRLEEQDEAIQLSENMPGDTNFVRGSRFYHGEGVIASGKDGAPHWGMVSQSALLFPALANRGLETILSALQGVAVYSPFPNTLRRIQGPNAARPMLAGGDNWASTLRALDKARWGGEIVAALGKLVGDIDDYRVSLVGGVLIPEFRHGVDPDGQGRWLGALQESDGTVRVAAMLTALYQEPNPSLLGFEEPELAVHPGALPLLFDFLDEASTRSQILLTTHSPNLLDLLDIEGIRVVERRDGVTTVARVDARQRDLVRRRLFSTSDLLHSEGLRAEGESGDA